jgi:uncharacterized protein YlxP (DUF503 family)
MSRTSIGILEVVFHLDGCTSLKERRGRLGGLRDRFGRNPRIALCEHPGDDPTHSAWTIVAVAGDVAAADELLAGVERDLESRVDAVVVDLSRERL